jgi:hypothetical protein
MRISVGGIPLALAVGALAWSPLSAASDVARPAAAIAIPAVTNDASADSAPSAPPSLAVDPKRANFLGEIASKDARRVADWVVASGDNHGLPFVIIDKVQAKVFVFSSVGQLRGAAMALLGLAHGDDTVPGIGSKKLSAIRPDERTTPAGRFVATLGHDLDKEVLWVDYDISLSLHPVIRGVPRDHRAERLATMSPLDKRISFGCINVPVKFFNDVVLKTFTGTNDIVYILPEVKTIADVFPAFYNVDAPRLQ